MQKINRRFIHDWPDWTAFRWDAAALVDVFSELNREVGFLAGRLSSIGFDTKLLTAAETLANDIIASSAIEGIILDATQVRSSVARRLGVEILPAQSSSHYVDGVVEMMLDATVNYSRPLTPERLFSWHCALFPMGRSGIQDINVGRYRTEAMKIVSGMFGRERVHYCAPAPERVEDEMAKFFGWFNSEAPSYIKSAIAHLWFVSIHPFDDGNGRIARAISDMCLAQTEDAGQRFYSVSTEINRNKSEYYEVLELTQQGDGDITRWLIWYLRSIKNAAHSALNMLSGVLRKTVFWQMHCDKAISNRQRAVLNRYLDGYDAKLTIKNYAKISEVSTDTAARDIADLIEKGFLRQDKGAVRNASFSLVYDDKENRFESLELKENERGRSIVATLVDGRTISEDISEIDHLRLSHDELTLADLANKYFSFIKL